MLQASLSSVVLALVVGFATHAETPAGPAGARATLTGQVLEPDGSPAAGAVVVTSAGGQCVTAADGTFALAVDVPSGAAAIQVTAVASAGSQSRVASASVAAAAPSSTTSVGRLVLASSATCEPAWLPEFGPEPGVGGHYVYSFAVFDDGSGPKLYVGGDFTTAGAIPAIFVARWDGTSWSPVGGGIGGPVLALAVFDDGDGPALYAGGAFTSAGSPFNPANNIAKWGTSWSALGSGISSVPAVVRALAVFDDGNGSALYAAGDFTSAGGASANSIAKWDGAAWSPLGSGFNRAARALAVFDDGTGPQLYAGGDFLTAGGVFVNSIAKWDGASWSALGSGVGTGAPEVHALTVFDDGSGAALYAGGYFGSAGGVTVHHVARWDGAAWSAVGGGFPTFEDRVRSLSVFDDGGGAALYAGGRLTISGSLHNVVKWDGATWSAAGAGTAGDVYTTGAFDDGSGAQLYAGGAFVTLNTGVAALRIARWDGASWSALGSGLDDHVHALAVFDDGGGPALYAGGEFKGAGGLPANGIAKWDGASWSPLDTGVGGTLPVVYALAVFDDGGGPALYAGGTFASAGGTTVSRIAKWDGSSWSALGSGLTGINSAVHALAVHDDGGGEALYAGGAFTTAGVVAASRIAKWDGASWSALGSGVDGTVRALAIFDDGGGPALYAGGSFTVAGGLSARGIAKWDGSSWSALGAGISDESVRSLAVFDDGGGAALYAGGGFLQAGGVVVNYIAKWNGTSWSALGSGTTGDVLALSVFDDGNGPALYAGGEFTTAGGLAALHIAKWDGASWSPLGAGVGGGVLTVSTFVRALTVFDDGGGAALHAGGGFPVSPAGDSYIAKWGCAPAIASVPGCAGNPATLTTLASGAPLGAPLPLLITGSAALSGVGLVYFGAPGFDASGCGILLPGIGELLLAAAPPPTEIASGVLAGGACALAPVVPSIPALRGFKVHLQAVAVQLVAPVLVEPTNALAVTLGP